MLPKGGHERGNVRAISPALKKEKSRILDEFTNFSGFLPFPAHNHYVTPSAGRNSAGNEPCPGNPPPLALKLLEALLQSPVSSPL